MPPSTPPPQLPPVGWYPDPEGSGSRWWDGEGWTEYFQASSGHPEEALADPTADSAAIVPGKEGTGIKALLGVLGGVAVFLGVLGGIALIAVVVTLVFHPDPGAQKAPERSAPGNPIPEKYAPPPERVEETHCEIIEGEVFCQSKG